MCEIKILNTTHLSPVYFTKLYNQYLTALGWCMSKLKQGGMFCQHSVFIVIKLLLKLLQIII